MTDKPKRSESDRRAKEERRLANIPIAPEEEKRANSDRRSGQDRRKKSE